MRGALLFIGDELISGRILNTNAEFAGKILSATGLKLTEIVTVPDEEPQIIKTFKRLLEEYDFVITSGGLGPTEDDLTTEAITKALNLELKESKTLLSAILSSGEYKGTLGMAKKMSMLPEGAEILSEDSKMLGFYLHYQGKKLFFLPGVPEQFRYLLKDRVIPLLCEVRGGERGICKEERILKNFIFFDLNETDLNQFILSLKGKEEIKIGYYPLIPEVRLVLLGDKEKVEEVGNQIKERFKVNLISEEDESLPVITGKILMERRLTLATAESCTGGYLASLITSISGSSAYFERGFVTYSAQSKIELLGVKEETLREKGIYSFETALEMAYGARLIAKTDFALSTTGIAGPTGGTAEIPVGTVFIGLSVPHRVFALHFRFEGDRQTIQRMASYTALDLLRRYLLYGESLFSYRFALGFKERTF
jgi:nicotinamide-nucleotide amidase